MSLRLKHNIHRDGRSIQIQVDEKVKSAIFMNGKRFEETSFGGSEERFENVVKRNSKVLFGNESVYLDIRKKIQSKSLGQTIPDGFLFDFRRPDDVQFYLVEVELTTHDFYKHIFPQITKFFAFFKNDRQRMELTEKLFAHITSDNRVEREFRTHVGKKDLFKTLKDVIENSQNILLVIDDMMEEIPEIQKTYTDTWGTKVKLEVLKEYTTRGSTVLFLDPEFEQLELERPTSGEEGVYTESDHFEGVDEEVIATYRSMRDAIKSFDPGIEVNPQKYYISLRKNRNFAYFTLRRKKMRVVIMLPYSDGIRMIRKHRIGKLSRGVQGFYGYPCFEVVISDGTNLKEVLGAIKKAYNLQK
jgi:predicted transport protein